MSPRRLLSAVAASATTAVAASALSALPALAQDGSGSRLAEAMRDRHTQEAMSESVRSITDALLAIRIGPLVRAIEGAGGGPVGGVDPDATLGEFAGPEVERLPDEMARRLPPMMGAMGEMAGSVEAALPALREIAEEMRARVEHAVRLPPGRD